MNLLASALEASISLSRAETPVSTEAGSSCREATAWALRLCFRNRTWSRKAARTGPILLSTRCIAATFVLLSEAKHLGRE
ncbi:MAG: hypothetical protein A2Y77_11625 [Planctomycetes bacterium RBG_13_62_9]|nr:MAG: hypothetical protein A2Y77_11625 [Planctomycetes bacterium RBG_13_62_9]